MANQSNGGISTPVKGGLGGLGGAGGRGGRGEGVGGGMVYLMQNSRGCPPHYMSRKKSALY